MQTKRGGKNMHLSFRAKISLTIITVSMAITCVLSMVFYQQSAQTVQENYTQAQMQQLTACAKLFDNTMLDAYSACVYACLLYTSPSPRDLSTSRMPSSA